MTSVLESLNQGLHAAFAADENVVLLGEDLLDPYGGAFKVPRGLSTIYPERVYTSPVSEAGLAGIATGMALRGLRPVVEIMFGDFLSLTFDQILNSATKYAWMFGDEVEIPVLIRTPMGGRRGYGPTHSQTLEKHFLGIPGLRVITPCAFGDPGEVLRHAILSGSQPTLFIENKLLYLNKLDEPALLDEFEISVTRTATPTFTFCISAAPLAILTLCTYGYMTTLALNAARQLAYEHEIFIEIVAPTLISFESRELPAAIGESLQKTRTLLTVEEGGITLGWGAEIVARANEASLANVSGRVGAADLPIPASIPMEQAALPDVDDIVQAALRLVK